MPDDGELWVDGRRVDYRSPRDALADRITVIAQEPTLVPHRSVQENVYLGVEGGRGGIVDSRRTARRFAALVRESGIELDPRRLARTLTVADQQKVEILRAMAREAQLIIMDEPTSALTADESERLFELIRRLRERGATIVYVSHFLPEVLALADTVTVLRDGRLVQTTAAASETPDRLVSAMLGRPLDLTFPDKAPLAPTAPVVLSVQGLVRPPEVQDVSFEIREGEIVGLAGLIGSGRTEVARAIFGADRPSGGSVVVDGEPLDARSPRTAIRRGVVMLPEDRKRQGLIMLRSIVENVTLPHLADLSTAGVMATRDERRRTSELIGRLDRADALEQRGRQHPLRRQPAEGAVREVALPAPSRVHPRRADARRGRGREGRDLRADPLAGGGGDGGAADLLGARGGARPRTSRARHARRPDRRGVRPADDERGRGAARRVRHRGRPGSMTDATSAEPGGRRFNRICA